MKRTVTVFILILLFLPKNALADIYRFEAKDGTIIFTDNPTSSHYSLVSRGIKRAIPLSKRYSTSAINKKILSSSRTNNLDPLLVKALIKVESNFRPNAVSNKGAIGLMQLMPRTANLMNVDPYDTMENIEGGTNYLRMLHTFYNGNIDYVLAAYNAGEEAVYRYGGIPPYRETVDFVRRVKRYYRSNLHAE